MGEPDAAREAERELAADLGALERHLWDDTFAAELYRGLARRTWRRADRAEVAVALSFKRVERLVNELRERIGPPALALDQTGGEGELSERVSRELQGLGWRPEPLDTSEHQEHHVSEPPSPPPPGHGEEHAPEAAERRWSSVASGEDARPGRSTRKP